MVELTHSLLYQGRLLPAGTRIPLPKQLEQSLLAAKNAREIPAEAAAAPPTPEDLGQEGSAPQPPTPFPADALEPLEAALQPPAPPVLGRGPLE